MARSKEDKKVTVRKYGLLRPLNWEKDCADHLWLMNRLWNNLVEIERAHRAEYRAVIDSDERVAEINQKIKDLKDQIAEQDALRKEARKKHRAKKGEHTKPFDARISELRAKIKELSPLGKQLRQEVRKQAKEALDQLEPKRKEAVKKAYQESGLWWSNYNAVIDSYKTARVQAMKAGVDLRFHRFDGTGRFRCQIQGGMSTEELLSGRHNIANIRMLDHDDFARLLGHRQSKQSYGSRNYERGYGVLSITVYTDKDEQGKPRRRMLEFPIILHRPLPTDANLKEIVVTKKRIGPDFRWDVVFTFTESKSDIEHPREKSCCGINLGWKQVEGGLRVATIFDGKSRPRHIVLPQIIVDKIGYVEQLRGEIDRMTNENFAWLLEHVDKKAPEGLAEAFTSMRRSKKPHPARFAHTVQLWRAHHEDYLPDLLEQAEERRDICLRKSREHHHLRDKVLRRREDFYRCQAAGIAAQYSRIAIDQMDLRQMAELEKADGAPTELHEKARHLRTIASVSTFRQWVSKQAAKTGSRVNALALKSSSLCHKCGEAVKASSTNVRTCLGCGSSWDEDENAAINLHRALGS